MQGSELKDYDSKKLSFEQTQFKMSVLSSVMSFRIHYFLGKIYVTL